MIPSDFPRFCEDVYEAATSLWYASGVERHAEGHPGLPGPSSGDKVWDKDKARIEAAIHTLQIILERKWSSETKV